MNLYKAQLKREIWENKVSFIYTPIIVSLVILLLIGGGAAFANYKIKHSNMEFSTQGKMHEPKFDMHFPQKANEGNVADGVSMDGEKPAKEVKNLKKFDAVSSIKEHPKAFGEMVVGMMYANAAILMIVFGVVLSAYTLRSLFDDRKNRDILFWRSLPVSETTNVLTKLLMVFAVAPVMILVANLGFIIVTTLVGLMYFALQGVGLGYLLSSLFSANVITVPLQVSFEYVLSLVVLFPVIGFALFSSAFAKKTPVFIFLSPLLLALVDKILISMSDVSIGVLSILSHYAKVAFLMKDAFLLQHAVEFSAEMIMPVTVSVAVGALLIAGTIWLRNNRYEI